MPGGSHPLSRLFQGRGLPRQASIGHNVIGFRSALHRVKGFAALGCRVPISPTDGSITSARPFCAPPHEPRQRSRSLRKDHLGVECNQAQDPAEKNDEFHVRCTSVSLFPSSGYIRGTQRPSRCARAIARLYSCPPLVPSHKNFSRFWGLSNQETGCTWSAFNRLRICRVTGPLPRAMFCV